MLHLILDIVNLKKYNVYGVDFMSWFVPYAYLLHLALNFWAKSCAQGTNTGQRGAKHFMKSTHGLIILGQAITFVDILLKAKRDEYTVWNVDDCSHQFKIFLKSFQKEDNIL